jgi:hypothetical protein
MLWWRMRNASECEDKTEKRAEYAQEGGERVV